MGILASERTPAMERTGTRFNESDRPKTAATAIKRAGMDWTVELEPICRQKRDGSYDEVDGKFLVVRQDNEDVLGMVAGRYVPFQNQQAFAFADSAAKTGDIEYCAAGEQRGGKVVFLSARVPELRFEVDGAGGPEVDVYLFLRTSHDGSKGIQCYVSPINLWCTNQLALSLKAAKQRWSIPHVSTAEERLAVVSDTLARGEDYRDAFAEEAQRLVGIKVSDNTLERTLKGLLPDRPRTGQVVSTIMELRKSSETIADDHRGTAWGAFNAVTEYMDWVRPVRSEGSRALTSLDGMGDRLRNNLVRALA